MQLTDIVYSANIELSGRLLLPKSGAHFFFFTQSERNDLFAIFKKKGKVSAWPRGQMQTLSRRGEHPARAGRPRPAPRGETSNSGPSATGRGHRSLGVEPRFRQVYVTSVKQEIRAKKRGKEMKGIQKRREITSQPHRIERPPDNPPWLRHAAHCDSGVALPRGGGWRTVSSSLLVICPSALPFKAAQALR